MSTHVKRTISFISANYVARLSSYNGAEDWSVHDRATISAISPSLFANVASDVAAAGFTAIDIWTAHANWLAHAATDHAEQVRSICAQRGLAITSYVGGLVASNPAELAPPFQFMQRLGAPVFAGGLWGMDSAQALPIVNDICRRLDLRWAVENHFEKSPQEMLAKSGDGQFDRVGIALDTGWCGTQAIDALEAVKRVRDRLFIVHLKDVASVGRHDTCALGEGIVPAEKVVRFLVESDWQGDIGIEHEPYNRDPMPEIIRSVERVKQWLA